MPIPEAELYIPQGLDMTKAFDTVKSRHTRAATMTKDQVRQVDLTLLQGAVSDYFTAGVAYLANRGHDDLIKEVGTTSWRSVNKCLTITALTENMVGAAIALGAPLGYAIQMHSMPDEPHVLFLGRKEGTIVIESAYVLMPPEFISKANYQPIEALASMTWICSQVRDLENGRLIVDAANFRPRAEAVEAHFLLEAQRRNPDFAVPQSLSTLLVRYPQGAQSMPRRLRY